MLKNLAARPDYILLAMVVILLLIGLMMINNISVFWGQKVGQPAFSLLFHQLLFGVGPGLLLGLIAFQLPLEKLRRFSAFFLLAGLLLLSLVFLPGLGWEAGGAKRWLKVGNEIFQPAEPVKLAFFFYLAAWLAGRKEKSSRELLGFLVALGLISALLLAQPDVGTLGVIAAVAVLVYFAASTPWSHTLLIGFLLIAGLFLAVQGAEYRVQRLQVFINPEADPLGAGYHIKQALIAMGSGGLFGKGLGLSDQKLGFLPHPLTDSIFAVLAEETGFVGASFMILLFLGILWRGFKIAQSSQDNFMSLLALALTLHLTLQAFINIGALIGVVPLTGLPLPFVSYGSSAMVVNLIEAGLLLNISRGTRI